MSGRPAKSSNETKTTVAVVPHALEYDNAVVNRETELPKKFCFSR